MNYNGSDPGRHCRPGISFFAAFGRLFCAFFTLMERRGEKLMQKAEKILKNFGKTGDFRGNEMDRRKCL